MGCSSSQECDPNQNGDLFKKPHDDAVEVQVQEEANVKPPTGEEGEATLPEWEFIHGKLGVTAPDDLETIKNNLGEDDLFEDQDFPAEMSSIFFSSRVMDDIEWKRPSELVAEPKLFIDGVSRRDVVQGALGDCWFLSSCSAVAREPKLIERVVPPDQVLFGDGYKGLVLCKFWRFGEWVTVCIDDRLPTKEGKPVFARSVDDNEYWVALIEKAYAKLHGSYEAMEGGQSMDAMVDMTGGLAERYDLEEQVDHKKIFKRILTYARNGAFITCSRKGDWRKAYKSDENGLVEGHAYTVTAVAPVRHSEKGVVNLIRTRNPWGNESEWTGEWSNGDSAWDGVSEQHKAKLGLGEDMKHDGESWMSFDDFAQQFEEVSVCTNGPDYNGDGVVDTVNKHRSLEGAWQTGTNAGGSRNNFKLFATNPQYLLHVSEGSGPPAEDIDVEDYDEENNSENGSKASVLIGLMQEHRLSDKDKGLKMLQISVVVYKTPDHTRPLPTEYFMYNYDVGTSGVYINYREVIAKLELEPGYYVIIPATFEPNLDGNFLTRVFSTSNFSFSRLK